MSISNRNIILIKKKTKFIYHEINCTFCTFYFSLKICHGSLLRIWMRPTRYWLQAISIFFRILTIFRYYYDCKPFHYFITDYRNFLWHYFCPVLYSRALLSSSCSWWTVSTMIADALHHAHHLYILIIIIILWYAPLLFWINDIPITLS